MSTCNCTGECQKTGVCAKIIDFGKIDKNGEMITEETIIDGRYVITKGWVEIGEELIEEYKELWPKLANL